MVQITEDLIRKKAEHNECIISTLEELSLHQQDIERIENIDKWCRDLKILYLQSNLIPKIENVGRLKKLEYLNLALNNVEIIENLEGCESLNKLDLTVNFVGELTSIETLKSLVHLRELYLTGNHCTQYVDYRAFVIATLPQLKSLDGIQIEKSERIIATQSLSEIRDGILMQQNQYRKKREEEKLAAAEENQNGEGPKKDGRWYTDINTDSGVESSDGKDNVTKEKTEEEKEKEFWDEKVPYTPESRVKIHEHMKEVRKRDEQKSKPGPDPPKRERRLQDENGRVFNVNEARIDFELTENDNNEILLDVAVFKHLETSLCDVDVQPTFVKVTIKGKILQLVLPEEVKPDSSSAKRSQITGHLLITMPKVNLVVRPSKKENVPPPGRVTDSQKEHTSSKSEPTKLEVDPTAAKMVDLSVMSDTTGVPKVPLLGSSKRHQIPERENSENFQDDPDVPPLM